jgi:hypothetical protein
MKRPKKKLRQALRPKRRKLSAGLAAWNAKRAAKAKAKKNRSRSPTRALVADATPTQRADELMKAVARGWRKQGPRETTQSPKGAEHWTLY